MPMLARISSGEPVKRGSGSRVFNSDDDSRTAITAMQTKD
jgi:hypothetical protein